MNIWKAIEELIFVFLFIISILYTLATDLFVILDLTLAPQWQRQCHFLHCQQMVSFFCWWITSMSLLGTPVADTLSISSALLGKWWSSSLHWGCGKALFIRDRMAQTILVWCAVPCHRESRAYEGDKSRVIYAQQERQLNVLKLRTNTCKMT